MRCSSIGLCSALAVATVAIVSAAPANAEVAYQDRIEHFELDVMEENPAAIWNNLRRYGPLAGAAIGAARGRLSWRYKGRCSPKGCVVATARVSVDVTLMLPKWERSRTAAPAIRAYWTCVEETVTTHENRHAAIWRETGERIDRALHAMTDPVPSADFDDRVNEIANRLHREGVRRQAVFDEEDGRKPRYQLCARHLPATPKASPVASPRPTPALPANFPSTPAPDRDEAWSDGGLLRMLANVAWAALAFGLVAAAYAAVMGIALRIGAETDPD